MITALYVRQDSIYKQLEIDCYDIHRDARTWQGGNPVIAHPPCRAWGDMATRAKPRKDEKELAIHAVAMVRKWGGVLEHPRKSKLWQECNLPQPGKTDEYGGWTLNIDQYWFGHKAKKNTNLYIVGINPKDIPELPIRFGNIYEKDIQHMSKKQREQTPEALAKWLIKLATKCKI